MAVSWALLCSMVLPLDLLRYENPFELTIDATTDSKVQTVQPNVIADVMFLHERGAYQTLYFVFYFGSLMVRS